MLQYYGSISEISDDSTERSHQRGVYPVSLQLSMKSVHGANINAPDKPKWKRILELCFILLCMFMFGCAHSIYSPFFPQRAQEKGMSDLVIGFTFGVYEFMLFLLCPVFGYLMPHFGSRFMLFSGTILQAGAAASFGLLNRCPSGAYYVILSILAKILEGIGAAMFGVCCASLATILFPRNLSFIYGIIEVTNSLGLTMGPLLGGWILDVCYNRKYGYQYVFYAVAVIMTLFSLVVLFFDSVSLESDLLVSPHTLFSSTLVWIISLSYVVVSLSYAYLEPTFVLHLNSIGVKDASKIGIVFTITGIAYMIQAIVIGQLVDRFSLTNTFISIGLLVSFVGYNIIGPTALMTWLFEANEVALTLGYSITQLGLQLVMLSIPQIFSKATQQVGLDPEGPMALGIVSGLYNGIYTLGTTIGATTSGILYDAIGFNTSVFIWSCMQIVCLLALMTYFAVDKINKRRLFYRQRFVSDLPAESESNSYLH